MSAGRRWRWSCWRRSAIWSGISAIWSASRFVEYPAVRGLALRARRSPGSLAEIPRSLAEVALFLGRVGAAQHSIAVRKAPEARHDGAMQLRGLERAREQDRLQLLRCLVEKPAVGCHRLFLRIAQLRVLQRH